MRTVSKKFRKKKIPIRFLATERENNRKKFFSVTILHKNIYPQKSKRANRLFGDLS